MSSLKTPATNLSDFIQISKGDYFDKLQLTNRSGDGIDRDWGE